MSDRTCIEWTDATWNPTVGCTKVSAGCTHCYAKTLHDMRYRAHLAGKRMAPQYSVPFGRVQEIPGRISTPYSWKTPKRIFVNSVSDLFHEQLSFGFIADVFNAMAHASWHTYQVLTKRPDRALQFVLWYQKHYAITPTRVVLDARTRDAPRPTENSADAFESLFRHVHFGVSVEDQRAADRRLPLLLAAPFAVRWLSCEPLLGHLDLSPWVYDRDAQVRALYESAACLTEAQAEAAVEPLGVHWIVAGGESGRGFRPLNLDHVRSLRDQAVAARVPFLFKQVGGNTPKAGGRLLDGREWNQFPETARATAA